MRNSLIIAAVLVLTYGLFLKYGPMPSQVKLQSQWEENKYAIEMYLRDSKADANQHEVVYVGSSLTKRLDFDEDSKCVYNLSLNGDSALTGLSVIANSAKKPRLVFIEINVPQRGVNQDLVEQATGLLPQLSPVFYIENRPINLALSYLSKKKDPAKELADEINGAARRNALTMRVQEYKGTLSFDVLKKNMTEFSRLVNNIESKGTKIVFFDIPIHSDLEYSPLAVQIRSSFESSFPNNKLIRFHELTLGTSIKTSDGAHLLMDEAKIVVKNMKVYYRDVCANPKFSL